MCFLRASSLSKSGTVPFGYNKLDTLLLYSKVYFVELTLMTYSKKNLCFADTLLLPNALFLRYFRPALVMFWKTAKIQGLFQGIFMVILPLKAWSSWVNRAFTTWVNRAFTTRVNRASTPWVNRAFTRWVHWLSLSQWTGCHPKRGLFVHFLLLFSKKSRHFSKVKM